MIDPIDAVAAQLPVGATVPDMPEVVDHVAVARLYGEPLFSLPWRKSAAATWSWRPNTC